MAKQSMPYVCSSCDYQTIKWLGCCPDCQSFDTIQLIPARKTTTPSVLTDLTKITTAPHKRMVTGIGEWDRVTGVGLFRVVL